MSASRQAAMLNAAGVILLLVGLGSAVLVYRLGQDHSATSNSNSDWKDSTLSMTDSKTNMRDVELYGGKLEILMVKCLNWLRRPESLAIIITTISALIALGFFLVARRLSSDPRSKPVDIAELVRCIAEVAQAKQKSGAPPSRTATDHLSSE